MTTFMRCSVSCLKVFLLLLPLLLLLLLPGA
jgi:hypothetical protein